MRIGIVGSRTFPQLGLVRAFINDLPAGITILSSGADGVDKAAAEYARARGLKVIEHLTDLTDVRERQEGTRAYARNQRIVEDADLIVGFTEREKGVTWATIRRARRAGKPVKVVAPSLFFPGDGVEDTTPEISESDPQRAGHGPFAMKSVSLGSYALKVKRHIQPTEWADILNMKTYKPAELGARIGADLASFFQAHRKMGFIHAVTLAPRSLRNLDKPHCMEYAAACVSEVLDIPYVQMFKPWEKSTRGRFAKHAEVEVLPAVREYVGRVVWVLDDVATTRETLRRSVAALTALEIHAHGLAWMMVA